MIARRRLLGAAAAGSAAVGLGAAARIRTDGLEETTPRSDTWPMARYDAANRGTNPDATAPRDATVDWTIDATGSNGPGTGTGTSTFSLAVGPKRVYATGAGVVAVARSDGRPAWERSVAAGPIGLHDGTVYAAATGTEDAGLYALDAGDGAVAWRTTIPDHGNHLIVGADTVLFGASHSVTAVGRDGEVHWQRATGSLEGGPAIDDGRVYVAAATVSRFARPTLLGAALGERGQAAWETEYVGHAAPPVVHDGDVLTVNQRYGGGRGGAAVAVAAADGTPRWRALGLDDDDAGTYPAAFHGRPAVTGDRAVVPRNVYRQRGSGEPRPTETAVVALTRTDGAVDWRQTDVGTPLTVAGVADAVLAGGVTRDGTGRVAAIDWASGEVRWRVSVGERVADLAAVDGTVFALTTGGRLAAIR